MPFDRLSEMSADPIGPTYSTAKGPVVLGEKLEVAEVFFAADKGAKPHHHAHEQMMYVVKGSIRARVEEERFVAEPGDIIHMPPNVEHVILANGVDTVMISVKNLVDGMGSPL